MPNWCKGSLKVRGKISDLKEFVQQGLEPVSYIGDALEPLVFTTEDETSFFVRENKVSLWMKGTHRHCCSRHWHCEPGKAAKDYVPKQEEGEADGKG